MAVHLSPRRKRRIRHRANVEAARTYQPAINAAKGGAAAARRTFRQSAGAARGYTNFETQGINSQIARARKMGAGGAVIGELRSRRSETKAALPFLVGDARTQLASDLTEARNTLTAARVDKLSHAGSTYTDLLNSAITDKAKRVKAQREATGGDAGDIGKALAAAAAKYGIKTAKRSEDDVRGDVEKMQLGLRYLHKFLQDYKANAVVDKDGNTMKDMLPTLKDGKDWSKVAAVVGGKKGLDERYAAMAIKYHLQGKRRRKKRARRDRRLMVRAQTQLPALQALPVPSVRRIQQGY